MCSSKIETYLNQILNNIVEPGDIFGVIPKFPGLFYAISQQSEYGLTVKIYNHEGIIIRSLFINDEDNDGN